MAARIAGVGGIALAAFGVAEAQTQAATTSKPAAVEERPLPFEELAKARGGNCGCSPCWGPPAPPVARQELG